MTDRRPRVGATQQKIVAYLRNLGHGTTLEQMSVDLELSPLVVKRAVYRLHEVNTVMLSDNRGGSKFVSLADAFGAPDLTA